jgi:hypothetical protein
MAMAREGRKALGGLRLRLPLGPRPPAPSAGRAWLVSAPAVVLAVVVALARGAQVDRALAAAAILALGAALHRWLSRRVAAPRGWLVVDDRGLRRLDGGEEKTLVDWDDGFGATVLARADRAAFALALTSPKATRFVPVRVTDAADGASAPTLLERATTAAESDLASDASVSLSASDAERLLQVIAARAPAALDRLHLVDASGEAVVLDRAELRVGGRRVDLAAPLEWRAFAYQELGAQAAWLCQATWVRQGEVEVFLVAPMPADASTMRAAPDARLLPTGRGEPPPRELRRAVDHVFMLPLRRALDRAPRISRVPSGPSMARPEGRA